MTEEAVLTQPVRTDGGIAPARPRCPMCGGRKFAAYNGRELARCRGCGAKERERLMALVLRKVDLGGLGLPVFHLAPETAMSRLLAARLGPLYRAGDFDPSIYTRLDVPVERVDLCRPGDHFAPGTVGGFLHSHVLEHVPGPLDYVIAEMNRALAPGGVHAFQVPIHAGWYREDIDPGMPPETREERFFQNDHVRVFGTEDFDHRLLRLFTGFRRIDVRSLVSHAGALAAGVPPAALGGLTGHSVFLFVKDGGPRRGRPAAAAEPPPHASA